MQYMFVKTNKTFFQTFCHTVLTKNDIRMIYSKINPNKLSVFQRIFAKTVCYIHVSNKMPKYKPACI